MRLRKEGMMKKEKFSPTVQWLGSYGLFIAATLSVATWLMFPFNPWYLICPLFVAAIWQQVYWKKI